MTDTHKGQCMCGAVKSEGHGAPELAICHCGMCQKWHGGPSIAVRFAEGLSIVDGESAVGWFRSSEWAERGFCKTCGSTLFYRLVSAPNELSGEAGGFDLPAGVPIKEHYFIDEKPDYYTFADNAPRLTGAETFAKYAGSTND